MSLETLPLPEMYSDWKLWAQALMRELRGEGEVGTDVGAISGLEEQIQDTIGVILTDSSTIDFTYDDTAPSITAIVKPASLNASYITDFAEVLDDRVAALLVQGTGITLTYDDGANTLTVATTITQYTDELAQDAVGGILTDSASIDFTYDDGAGTITAIVKAGSIGPTELAATAVTPGSYTNTNLTVDADGRVTAAANGSATLAMDGAKVRKAAALTAQNLTSITAVVWTAEDWDTGGYHDLVTNTDRLTPPATGYYQCTGQLVLNNVASGSFVAVVLRRMNSSDVLQEVVAVGNTEISATGDIYINVSGTANFASGDFLRMVVLVETDTSVDIATTSFLEIRKVG